MNRRAWRVWRVGWLIWFGWLIWTAWTCSDPAGPWFEIPWKRHTLSITGLGQFLLPMMGVWCLVAPGRPSHLVGSLLLLIAAVVVPALAGFLALAGWAGWASGWPLDALRAGRVMLSLAGAGVLVGVAIRAPNGLSLSRRALWAVRTLAIIVFGTLLLLASLGSRGPEQAEHLKTRLAPFFPQSAAHPDPFPLSQQIQIKAGAGRGPGTRGWVLSVSDPRFEVLPDRMRVAWSVGIAHWQPRTWLKPPSRPNTWHPGEYVGIHIERTPPPPEGFYHTNRSGGGDPQRSGMFVVTGFTRTDFFRLITSKERRSLTAEELTRLHSRRETAVREWASRVRYTFTATPRPPRP